MNVNIRKYRESDAEPFQAAVLESMEHLSRWLAWCTPDYSIEDARQWAETAARVWEAGTEYRFLIEDSDTRQILGSVGINRVVRQHMVGDLGYWVRKSALGRGVCTRAARLAIEYAFVELGLQRIEVHVHPDNTASNSVADKLGGVYEGVFRNKLIVNGVSGPANCYSIVRSDYGLQP